MSTGLTVAVERTSARDGAIMLTGWLGRAAAGQTVEVGLTTTTVRPHERDPSSPDQRPLGVAVSEIELLSRG
ncbi:MAG TPA: hypothetical protein VMU39_20800 [Solirubrobacteraceae bacterium]|nr:hypothetical protein [Solirubrobacteraceae bacterium]